MPRPVKSIVEAALTPQRARKLWTANYYEALPIAPQRFEVGSLLPSMLYMARFGHRRGRGRFVETFGKDRHGDPQAPTIASVSARYQAHRLCLLSGVRRKATGQDRT